MTKQKPREASKDTPPKDESKAVEMDLDPKQIGIPAVRIDADFEEGTLQMLGDDISKNGIEQRLLIAECDGEYWVIDGRHRLEEALRIRLPTVPCTVRKMDLKGLQMRNLASNVLKGKTKVSEEIRVIGDLYNTHHATIDEITEKTGMKRDRIETMVLISSAHPEILLEIDAGRINVCHAKELIRLPEHTQQYTMLQIVLQYRTKCPVVKEMVDEALKTIKEMEGKKDRPIVISAPPVPTAACSCCSLEYPIPQMTSPLLCRGCFATLIQAYQEGMRMLEEEEHRKLSSSASGKTPGNVTGT